MGPSSEATGSKWLSRCRLTICSTGLDSRMAGTERTGHRSFSTYTLMLTLLLLLLGISMCEAMAIRTVKDISPDSDSELSPNAALVNKIGLMMASKRGYVSPQWRMRFLTQSRQRRGPANCINSCIHSGGMSFVRCKSMCH